MYVFVCVHEYVHVYIWLGNGGSYHILIPFERPKDRGGVLGGRKPSTKQQRWLKMERVKVKGLLSVLSALPTTEEQRTLSLKFQKGTGGVTWLSVGFCFLLPRMPHTSAPGRPAHKLNFLSHRPEWS